MSMSRLPLGALLIVIIALALGQTGCPPPSITVPDVVGMTLSEAGTTLTDANLVPGTVTEVFSATVPDGEVISQDPAAGADASSGDTVNMVVSKGPQTEPGTVPNVVGMAQAAAETALTSVGYAVGNVTQDFDDTVPAGQVISQDPAAGTSLVTGSAVDLVVSKGPALVEETIMLPGDVPLVMVTLPTGSFMMGRYAGEQNSYEWESPQHQVTFAHSFAIGKYKVTQEQWQAVMGDNPSFFTGVPGRPVDTVSWNDAQAFITALNALGHGVFRLPSEAEWEYACRAGTTTRFFWGDDLQFTKVGTYSWYIVNSGTVTHPVGQKAANPWGLYDMTGDVWEWCQDWWHDDYTGAPTDGSAWESPAGSSRVGRGGAWNGYSELCRSAYRSYDFPENSADTIGFRLAK